ncbi:hypothetical protein LO763_20220 [Glycomyces sp. A-F 0318]|uniref:hypothetical protein n=1 Tax=Glycomyces amatae TaxID=2881355 RepID=UPI001E515BA5|nr:hypothetical protein [Glycomyces amatae]MCD0445941.1 hypothetical protein [Glycomyces amatae]
MSAAVSILGLLVTVGTHEFDAAIRAIACYGTCIGLLVFIYTHAEIFFDNRRIFMAISYLCFALACLSFDFGIRFRSPIWIGVALLFFLAAGIFSLLHETLGGRGGPISAVMGLSLIIAATLPWLNAVNWKVDSMVSVVFLMIGVPLFWLPMIFPTSVFSLFGTAMMLATIVVLAQFVRTGNAHWAAWMMLGLSMVGVSSRLLFMGNSIIGFIGLVIGMRTTWLGVIMLQLPFMKWWKKATTEPIQE